MGTRFAEAAGRPEFLPGVELAGVCDQQPEKAEALGARFGVPHFGSVDDLLERVEPEAVYVATPDAAHRDPVVAAARRGVHVVVEKPLATRVEDALVMLREVEAADVVAEVHFGNRWSAPFVAAKRAIDEGEIGDVLSFMCRLNNAIAEPARLLAWAGQTTSAWFLLSHVLDLARWLSGKQAEVTWANGSRRKLSALGIGAPDYVHAMVRYTDGTDGLFEASWVLPESMPTLVDFKFEVIGSEGALFIDTQDQMVHLASRQGTYRYLSTLDYSRDSLRALMDRVAAGDRSRSTFTDGLENTRTLVAIHTSLETGVLQEVR